MLLNNMIKQYVGVGSTKAGVKVFSLTLSKEELTKALANDSNMTIRIYPDNELKQDKNGKDYLLGTVSVWTTKVATKK